MSASDDRSLAGLSQVNLSSAWLPHKFMANEDRHSAKKRQRSELAAAAAAARRRPLPVHALSEDK